MENILLAIVSDNKEYAKALSLAVLNVCRDFTVRILLRNEFIHQQENYCIDDSKTAFCGSFDLILWDGQESVDTCGDNIIIMVEKPSLVFKDYENKKFSLYKYSAAKNIVAEIFEIYSTLTRRRAVNLKRQDVRLMAFASWAGGVGCSTAAMSVAQELCRFRAKRVMYLCFEEVESTGRFMECKEGIKGVGVYLYELFKAVQKGYPFLEEYTVKDVFGVESFAPTKGKNPLRYVSVDELHVFLTSLIDSGRYDVIIMDVGNCLSEVGIWCMNIAERVCIVSSSTVRSCAEIEKRIYISREEQYFQQLKYDCDKYASDKIIKVVNMFCGEREDCGTKAGGEHHPKAGSDGPELYIEKNPLLERENIGVCIELGGQYGQDISRLAERMTEPTANSL